MEDLQNREIDKTLEISRAVPSDARAIMELTRDAQIDAYPNAEYGVTDETIRKRFGDLSEGISNWQDGIASEDGVNTVSFVARVGGEIVGFVHPVRANENGQQMVKQLYIRTDAQGIGIGKKLLQQALSWLKTNEDIYLHVVSYNQRAIGLYEQFGFEKTGNPIPDGPNDNDDDVSYDIEMVLKANK